MTNDRIRELAKQAGVRLVGSWLEGHQDSIYRFAELVVQEVESGVDYLLWPDGTYCERHEREQMLHMSDDFITIRVTEWDDNGEPMFPGGLV